MSCRRAVSFQPVVYLGDLFNTSVGQGNHAVAGDTLAMVYVGDDADVADLVLVRDDL